MNGAMLIARLQRALTVLVLTVMLMVTGVGMGFLGLSALMPSGESRLLDSVLPSTSLPIHPAARATQAPATEGAHSGAPTPPVSLREVQTVELAASSVDGPALWVRPPASPSSGAASPSGGNAIGAVLAWADTGPYQRLHLMISPDGLHYTRELLLNAYANARPAVVVVPVASGGPSAAPTSVVIVAWAGWNSAHALYLMYDALGAQRILALPHSSFQSPALAYFAGQLWLAWTDTTTTHALHIQAVAITADGLVPGADTVLSAYGTRAAPGIAADDQHHQLLLTWTSTGSSSWIHVASSPDGLHWQLMPDPGLAPQSSGGSTILPVPTAEYVAPGMPEYYWAWPSNDSSHTLTVMLAPALAEWESPVIIPAERCVGAPALAFIGSAGQSEQILLAWTGIDPAHHLTVAVFQVSRRRAPAAP